MVPNEPEVLLDSGLTISLAKTKALLVYGVVTKYESPIIMEMNPGKRMSMRKVTSKTLEYQFSTKQHLQTYWVCWILLEKGIGFS